MIRTSVVNEIRRLLGEGRLSQRSIARQLGVSRGTVNGIALGRRPEPSARGGGDDPFEFPTGPLERCPGCGGMVFMPCLACRIRASRRAADRRQRNANPRQ